MCKYALVCVRRCVRVCVRACVRVRADVCMYAHINMNIKCRYECNEKVPSPLPPPPSLTPLARRADDTGERGGLPAEDVGDIAANKSSSCPSPPPPAPIAAAAAGFMQGVRTDCIVYDMAWYYTHIRAPYIRVC